MPDFSRWGANGGDASLNAIARTDRYLDSLAAEQPVYATDPGDAELANLMAGWRDDVRRPPAAGVVTQRDAEIALARAVGARKRTRMSMAVVGSTAAALLCLGGFGAVVYGAGPGDALYGLRTALFGEQQVTRDDRVALAAQTEMQQVQQLIDRGDWTAAQDKLETITSTVQTVEDPQRQEELQQQLNQLAVKVENRDPEATLPAAPLGPAAPVGPGAPGVQLPGLPPSDAFTLPSLPPFELPVPVPGPGVPPVISSPHDPIAADPTAADPTAVAGWPEAVAVAGRTQVVAVAGRAEAPAETRSGAGRTGARASAKARAEARAGTEAGGTCACAGGTTEARARAGDPGTGGTACTRAEARAGLGASAGAAACGALDDVPADTGAEIRRRRGLIRSAVSDNRRVPTLPR